MEQIRFSAGVENGFWKFISALNDTDKIALISHNDLDGVASAKIINEVVNADVLRFVSYSDLNDSLIEEMKKLEIKRIIFSDLMIASADFVNKLSEFADILIIDHHLFSQNYNSHKVVFLNAQGYCATYIAYYLFSQVQDIGKWDWLVACASVADWMYFKNAEWMNEVYEKYGDRFVPDSRGIKEGTKFWETQWKLSLAIIYFREDVKKVYDLIGSEFGKIGKLEECAAEVQLEIESGVKRFEKEKINIKDGFFWEFKPNFQVGSIVSTIVSSEKPDKLFVIGRTDGDQYNISGRRQDGKQDVSLFLKKLVAGFEGADAGGHMRAAGGHMNIKDVEEFKKRLFSQQ